MRITQSSMTRNYLKSLNRNLKNLNDTEMKMASGRRFNRMSEDVASGARALKVREQQYKNEQSLENMSQASSELSSMESNMKAINDIVVTAQEKVLKALSGTTNAGDKEILAKEISNIQEQILQFANAQFADKYQFSGSGNGAPPFVVDGDGALTYNGIKMADIFKSDTDGKFYYKDAGGVDQLVPTNEDVFIDIGLGLIVNGDEVDPTSAFKVSFSGLDILGFGTDKDTGLPGDLYSILGDLVKAISPTFDGEKAGALKARLSDQRDKLMINVTEVGTRSNFLEKSVDRLETDNVNLAELRNKLEATDDTTEAMNMKMYQYSWMASLQFGSQILPQSIMDFMN